jgi:hypothetical protein
MSIKKMQVEAECTGPQLRIENFEWECAGFLFAASFCLEDEVFEFVLIAGNNLELMPAAFSSSPRGRYVEDSLFW